MEGEKNRKYNDIVADEIVAVGKKKIPKMTSRVTPAILTFPVGDFLLY